MKAGKRLLLKFGDKFQAVICGKDGPYKQFERGLLKQADLPITIVATILTAGFSLATFWYPLGVYVGLLLVKTGLKSYCEPARSKPQKRKNKSERRGGQPWNSKVETYP